jgi:tetratricopeptide (TPR) repeat protein
MRATIPFLFASLALASLAVSLAPRARAEDVADDTSAASKAYRDGWWAETGGGNLTRAVELYTKAADAEGPASVKARALYRKAIVLQRIGKTEEAIRTLERLAKDFAGEVAMQTDARARLAEWTAVDLKTSFADWYRRYQYSPEFQAKIVDLVLKMGASDAAVSLGASSEILTIGAPAIAALRQHVDKPNLQLRERVVPALLQLGEVPSMEALRWTSGWRNDLACWTTLRSASGETRARLHAEAKSDQPWDQGLLAAIEGPAAFLTWANTPAAKDVAEAFLSNGLTWSSKGADLGTLRPLLVALVENKALSERARIQPMYGLFAVQGVDAALAEKWAMGDDRFLRIHGVGFLADPRGGPASFAALRRLLKPARMWDKDQTQWQMFGGVLAGLHETPPQADLDELADDLNAITPNIGNLAGPLSAPARALLASMVDRARESDRAGALLREWLRTGAGSEGNPDRLAAWVRSTPWQGVRDVAISELVNSPDPGPRRALALLNEPGLSDASQLLVFRSLLQSKASATLLADPTSRRALLAALRKGEETNKSQYANQFLNAVLRLEPEGQRAIAQEWIEDPVAFPRTLLLTSYQFIGMNAASWRAAMTTLGPAFRKAWPSWTPAQRDAAVEGLEAVFAEGDKEMHPFLEVCARDRSNGVSPESRAKLLRFLNQLSVDDLRLAFDLSTPEGTDAAIEFVPTADFSNPLPAGLFEALHLGLRSDAPEKITKTMLKLFEHDSRSSRPLIEALLAHRDGTEELAVNALAARESADDLPLWLVALSLPDVEARVRAATGLGRVPHPDATKALVKALDDPNSRVRDAAIASLEAIQKIEDLKKQWREKVR